MIRARLEQADAGNGYNVATGTWKLVRGTGDYAALSGGGRVANVWLSGGSRRWSERREGFLVHP